MRDDETSSEWLHFTGECIAGAEKGRSLEMLSTTMMSWRAFRETFAGGTTIPLARQWWRRLIGRVVGGRRSFTFLPKTFRDTMTDLDDRLPKGELGLGVFIGKRSLVRGTTISGASFYTLKAARRAKLIADVVGSVPIAVVYDETIDSPVALVTELDGERVVLGRDEAGRLRDESTGSTFDALGRCIGGRLLGKRLELAPSVFTRWYGFSQTYRDVTIWAP